MDLQFTSEEKSFRQDVRNFIRDNLPKETRERLRLGYSASKPQIVEWLKMLNARGGWSVPGCCFPNWGRLTFSTAECLRIDCCSSAGCCDQRLATVAVTIFSDVILRVAIEHALSMRPFRP